VQHAVGTCGAYATLLTLVLLLPIPQFMPLTRNAPGTYVYGLPNPIVSVKQVGDLWNDIVAESGVTMSDDLKVKFQCLEEKRELILNYGCVLLFESDFEQYKKTSDHVGEMLEEGTVSIAPPKLVHRAAPAAGHRALAFCTYNLPDDDDYDSDSQHSAVTLVAEAAMPLWPNLNPEDREYMLRVLIQYIRQASISFACNLGFNLKNKEEENEIIGTIVHEIFQTKGNQRWGESQVQRYVRKYINEEFLHSEHKAAAKDT